jgi:CRP/FNR family transcriptional regulator, cyclic AMP receptor protein
MVDPARCETIHTVRHSSGMSSAPTLQLRALDGRAMLGAIGIFEGLSRRELDLLHGITGTKRLRPREVLFRKGDPGSALYGVLRGRLRVFSHGADAKEVVFRFLDAGDVLGEVALFDAQVRSATVEAVEACELLSLQRRDLLPFLEQQPRVAIKLAAVLARSLRELSQRVEDEMSLTIPARLARKLLELMRTHGSTVDGKTRIDQRLPQHILGELVGATRESINKQMRLWVGAGAIEVDRGFVTVLDASALEETARFGPL